MNTETTGIPADDGIGTVFYDADCAWCRRLARRWDSRLAQHGFRAVPLQTPGAAERLGVSPDKLRERMHLLTADGRRYCGADAFVEIVRARRWSRPLAWIGGLPGVRPVLRWLYDWIAARRSCVSGACQVPRCAESVTAVTAVLPLLALPLAALFLRGTLPAWVFMWVLALALFAGCKWLTWRDARRRGVFLEHRAAWIYLLGWVGMEPREFAARLKPGPRVRPVCGQDPSNAWVAPAFRMFAGAALVWGGVRMVLEHSVLAAGWLGMVGTILFLHFGLFDVLALLWRRAGYPVKPLMNRPAHATSVGDFWSVRWNRGFHALAHQFVYRPLAPRLGRGLAVLGVFLGSGLIHDLVITVPARGGYGLPTIYFLLQGLALLLERSVLGRRLGLARGVRGRVVAVLIVAGPAFWLFPPVFVRNVILPMLQAIGATS